MKSPTSNQLGVMGMVLTVLICAISVTFRYHAPPVPKKATVPQHKVTVQKVVPPTSPVLEPPNTPPVDCPNTYTREKLPKLIQKGTVTFHESGSPNVKIPVIGIKAEYGMADTVNEPSITPKKPFPPFTYDLDTKDAKDLALFYINNGYNTGGIYFLGPRHWISTTAQIGADGSIQVVLENPENNNEVLSLSDDGGCQGCTISSIGTYFPSYAVWAKKLGFPPIDKHIIATAQLSKTLDAYTRQFPSNPYPTYGIADEQHNPKTYFYFGNEEMTVPKKDNHLASVILNFYIYLHS